MNREQAVSTNLDIKKYIDKNKLRPMFAQLTKELLLKKPNDPIAYLIEYLNKRTRKQIVCLKGYDDEERNRLANVVCNKFNFKLIDVSSLFNGKDYHFEADRTINQKVLVELKNVDNVHKGVIISGYPNNYHQLDYIQKSGFLPDRYFYLPFDEGKILDKYKSNFKQTEAENLMQRNQLQNKELSQNLGKMIDFLPLDFDKASEIFNATLSIKAKKNVPFDSPRSIFVHPPYLYPPNMQCVIQRFSLYHISLQTSMKSLCEKQSFKDYVEQYIRKTGRLSKEIELALIETQCKSSAARNKGYILSGWPSKKQNLKLLSQKFLDPHIIFVFDLDSDTCLEQFEKLQEGDPSIFSINKKPSSGEYKKLLKEYEQLIDLLRENPKVQILPWKQNEKQLLKTYESLIENPKIYS